jgi:nitrate reductase gamma subunit
LNAWDQFLWVIFPYLTLVTFVLGHVYRYRYDQYGWTPKSSQLLERRLLMWSVLLFHWGFLFVFVGHVMGLLVLIDFYHAFGISNHNYHLLSLWAGAPVGIVAMIGILLLNIRRWFIPRIRNNTDTIRFITDALLLVVIVLGLAATIGYRVYASQFELHGEFEYRDSMGVWFRNLFLFRPEAALMVGAPLIFQLHTLSAFVLFALWPFSSLVHVFSIPLGYLRRSYVQYRSSNPQATLARERTRKAGKESAKIEQSSRLE